jgi:hypothetical protein
MMNGQKIRAISIHEPDFPNVSLLRLCVQESANHGEQSITAVGFVFVSARCGAFRYIRVQIGTI